MTLEMRNDIFLQYQSVIWWVINKNRSLICALQLEEDDVFQELAIAALTAIESFDSGRSASMYTHVVCKLQYAVLSFSRYQKPHGLTGSMDVRNASFAYIDDADFGQYPLEMPVSGRYDEAELMADIFSLLSPNEQSTVRASLEGHTLRKKEQRATMAGVQEKVRDYYSAVLAHAAAV